MIVLSQVIGSTNSPGAVDGRHRSRWPIPGPDAPAAPRGRCDASRPAADGSIEPYSVPATETASQPKTCATCAPVKPCSSIAARYRANGCRHRTTGGCTSFAASGWSECRHRCPVRPGRRNGLCPKPRSAAGRCARATEGRLQQRKPLARRLALSATQIAKLSALFDTGDSRPLAPGLGA